MKLRNWIDRVSPLDESVMAAARERQAQLAKPPGSLGRLEDLSVQLAGITGKVHNSVRKQHLLVFAADNGVVEEGVSQTGQEVTAVVTENMARELTSVCRMARIAHAEVIPVDIGVAREVRGEKILQKNIRRGTANMTKGPAMTREEAIRGILTGFEVAEEAIARGAMLLATGEMGIGNTTTASAVAAVLLNKPVPEVTGRGAGLSGEGLKRKVAAIEKAIAVNRPDANDPIDVLAKVGGLDIAGLAGVFLGGAAHHVPVLIDGAISGAAALIAARLCPDAQEYMLASHTSDEPCGDLILAELGLAPFLKAGMHLGEGTGAVAAMPLLDMALAVYSEMPTFDEIAIEAYQPLK